MAVGIKDRHLLEKSFRLMCSGVKNVSVREFINKELYYNVFSSAPGDNRYVNPLPQFSPATDPRPDGIMATREGGMGAQYKRIYDNNASLVSFTVGVPEFTGLLTFMLNMFDPVAAVMANKGRAPSFTFYIGAGIGTVAYAPLQLISIGYQFFTWLINTPRNQFYYVKPAMGMYLQAANNLLNDIMVAQGYIKPLLQVDGNDVAALNGVGKENASNYRSEITRLSQFFPDVVNDDGTIDLMRLVGRGTRKWRRLLSLLKNLDNDKSIKSPEEKFQKMESIMANTYSYSRHENFNTAAYLNKELETVGKIRSEGEANYPEQASSYLSGQIGNSAIPVGETFTDENGNEVKGQNFARANTTDRSQSGAEQGAGQGLNSGGEFGTATPQPGEANRANQPGTSLETRIAENQVRYSDDADDRGWLGNIGDLLMTQFAGGFDAITFRCEHQGAVTDNFSNSFAPSPMAEKFNSMTRAVNEVKFDMAGGATGVPILDTAIEMGKDAIMGVASSLQIANIPMAIANNSYVNIPEHWADASANIHKETYSFTFESLYAHPYSQITNLWIYFALLAPLCMPNAVGGSTYTSPFMLKCFSKSRQIIRVGMVESATFTFGEGVGGWTRDRKPLTLKVDLTIADMEKFIAIPIARTSGVMEALTNPAAGVRKMLTDVGKYNEYVTRLSGQDYLDTVLRWNDLSKRLTTTVTGWKQGMSASNFAGMIGDSVIGDIGFVFTRQISR